MYCNGVYSNVSSVGLKSQPESKCPELLANYCDMLLRKTPLSKKLTSEEIEAKLKEVVSGATRTTQREDEGNTHTPSSKLLPFLWSELFSPIPGDHTKKFGRSRLCLLRNMIFLLSCPPCRVESSLRTVFPFIWLQGDLDSWCFFLYPVSVYLTLGTPSGCQRTSMMWTVLSCDVHEFSSILDVLNVMQSTSYVSF